MKTMVPFPSIKAQILTDGYRWLCGPIRGGYCDEGIGSLARSACGAETGTLTKAAPEPLLPTGGY